MSIPFTQFLMPNGRQQQVTIDRSFEVEELARKIIQKGYVFEIEMLDTGEISMEVVASTNKEDVIASEICNNNEEVPISVDKIVNHAACHLGVLAKDYGKN